MAYKVLMPQDISDAGKNYLIERGYEIVMGSGFDIDSIKKDVVDCDAILARTASYPKEIMEAGKKLKVISRHGVGVNNIDLKAAEDLGIYVTNGPESNYKPVAEHVIGFIIALARNFVFFDRETRAGKFSLRNKYLGMDVEDKILGIAGFGKIGRTVAEKAHFGLSMKVICYDPYLKKENAPDYVTVVPELDELLSESDFITLHLPFTPETENIISKDQLAKMKKSAYLINAARGELVNEKDLITALEGTTIAGAAVDVFSKEPPDKHNPLLKLDNIIVSPHNAALTKECMDKMALHAAIGIDEVLSGEKPTWPVNKPVLNIIK